MHLRLAKVCWQADPWHALFFHLVLEKGYKKDLGESNGKFKIDLIVFRKPKEKKKIKISIVSNCRYLRWVRTTNPYRQSNLSSRFLCSRNLPNVLYHRNDFEFTSKWPRNGLHVEIKSKNRPQRHHFAESGKLGGRFCSDNRKLNRKLFHLRLRNKHTG